MSETIVRVFTTAECPYCGVVKAYLNSLAIPFEEIDLNQTPQAAAWIRERIGQIGVPIVFFGDDEYVLGWQRQQIDAYLKEYGLMK